MSRTREKIDACWGCGKPLPPQRLGPNPHRIYHDETCRELHDRRLAEFRERNPELPGQGKSRVPHPGSKDRLRAVRASDGRLSVKFEKGPAKRGVKEHHETDTLPVEHSIPDRATVEDAAEFLQHMYPEAEVVL